MSGFFRARWLITAAAPPPLQRAQPRAPGAARRASPPEIGCERERERGKERESGGGGVKKGLVTDSCCSSSLSSLFSSSLSLSLCRRAPPPHFHAQAGHVAACCFHVAREAQRRGKKPGPCSLHQPLLSLFLYCTMSKSRVNIAVKGGHAPLLSREKGKGERKRGRKEASLAPGA